MAVSFDNIFDLHDRVQLRARRNGLAMRGNGLIDTTFTEFSPRPPKQSKS
jgi:hypothetical protein